MNRPLAVFRVDGSNQIGMGHIFRCLALAKSFERCKVKPLFLTKDNGGKTQALIEQYHFPVHAMHHTIRLEEDASLTNSFLKQKNARFLITDIAHLENTFGCENYEHYCMKVLNKSQAFSISFDDLLLTALPFDLRIVPYFGVMEKHCPIMAKGKTKFLLGSDYFVFQEPFIEISGETKIRRRELKNILISMGGSDPSNLTPKVMEGLPAATKQHRHNIRVIIGPGFSRKTESEIRQKVGLFGGMCEIISGASDAMAKLIFWADLVISAGGLTKYEAAVTGTPCVIIATTDREVEMCRAFADVGASLCFNFQKLCIEQDLPTIVETIQNDYELRKEMSLKGKELFDGKGVERIFGEIPTRLFR